MKPSQVFGVVVRSFGLFLMVWGLWNIASLIIEVVSMVAALFTDESMDLLTNLYYLVAGAGALLIGFVLLAKADTIVRWAYRHESAVPPEPRSVDPVRSSDALDQP